MNKVHYTPLPLHTEKQNRKSKRRCCFPHSSGQFASVRTINIVPDVARGNGLAVGGPDRFHRQRRSRSRVPSNEMMGNCNNEKNFPNSISLTQNSNEMLLPDLGTHSDCVPRENLGGPRKKPLAAVARKTQWEKTMPAPAVANVLSMKESGW